MSNLWNKIRNGLSFLTQTRVYMIIIIICILFSILLGRIFNLQIINGQGYSDDYKLQILKTKRVQGTRGNIYDRNGKLLAYSELSYSVTIEDNGESSNEEINKVITSVIQIVERNGDSMVNDFGIFLDQDNVYQFVAQDETQRLRFIADIYGLTTIDKLTTEQQNSTAEEMMDYLCTDKSYGYGINTKKLEKTEVLKLVTIRYAIALHSFEKYIEITMAEDVSDETVADIMENLSSLQGIDIKEDSLRRYTDSETMAFLIGYTGHISTDEYNSLSKEEKKNYSLTDIVGKSGLEQKMDSYLQGEKVENKIYVNNVGKVIDAESEKEPKAGNDLYLSIDADLQRVAYHVLEQELAGIIVSKLTNVLDFDRSNLESSKDIPIPIGDVYNALIANEVLNIRHFTSDDAGVKEKEVQGIFDVKKAQVLETVSGILNDPSSGTYNEQSKEIQGYLSYIVNNMLTSADQVIQAKSIDTEDETYLAWLDGSINIHTYLNYLISKNWIDSSKLNVSQDQTAKYSDSTELYEGMSNYIRTELNTDHGFDKLVYESLIRSGEVSGSQLALILYEQGVLPADEGTVEALNNGSLTSNDFFVAKITNLELTPGQLALEPCTGSFVMTDTNTGKVLACVSYPGYDNNRLANTMDSTYYNKLVNDKAKPFYNNATQEATAPGSTYKPIAAIAGLSEGVVTTDTIVACDGVYKKVEPNIRCWIYPGSHGNQDITSALANSCNEFFNEIGYRLSLKGNGLSINDGTENATGDETETYYSSTLGTNKLETYANKFGLGEPSGIEISETEPHVSTEMSVPSAIGQGTNNFTTSQLAKYTTTLANGGVLYDLSVLNKVVDQKGEIVESFDAVEKNRVTDIASESWGVVQNGMRRVVTEGLSTVFSPLEANGIAVSGKSGTAQQSDEHADHALFIGFAPSDTPQIAFATRIANGYTSTYTAEVASDILRYYYQIASEEEILTKSAKDLSTTSTAQRD
ncbi:penicillin-binding protein 2 [Aequitasia blattaphilus]